MLTVGQHFGEVGVLLPQTPCIATAVATTRCTLLTLESSAFIELFGQDGNLLAEMQLKLLRSGCVARAPPTLTRRITEGGHTWMAWPLSAFIGAVALRFACLVVVCCVPCPVRIVRIVRIVHMRRIRVPCARATHAWRPVRAPVCVRLIRSVC